jgi:hypothetical protein
MGQGIDAARAEAPLHAAVLDNLKDQLLIAFVARLGGKVTMPVAEVDGTGDKVLAFSYDAEERAFIFTTSKKS